MEKLALTVFLVLLSWECTRYDNAIGINQKFDYSIEQTPYCITPLANDKARIFVIADTICNAISLSTNKQLPYSEWDRFKTIKALYNFLALWDTSYYNVNVQYDPQYGYPSMISINSKPPLYVETIGYETKNYIKGF
jgi:hypothetical protein